MAHSLLNKLRTQAQRAQQWLSARWQALRSTPPTDNTRYPATNTDLSLNRGSATALPPNTDFASQLQAAAARTAESSAQGTAQEGRITTHFYGLSHAREYLVYTPADYHPDEALPLVMVLHGCRQNQHDIRAISGFDAIADRERFIVVYPFVTTYFSLRNKNCWAWWMRSHIRAGSGEVEDLHRIIQQVQTEFSVDNHRIHICGLSSGAGMSVAALVAHGKLFASGASVAGVAYAETARAVRISPFLSIRYRALADTVARMQEQLGISGRLAPLLVIQSAADQTVEAPAALNLRDSWLAINHMNAPDSLSIGGDNRGIPWQYQRYLHASSNGSTNRVTDLLMVEQLAHGWIGGLAGEYADARGPNISEMIWLFFSGH